MREASLILFTAFICLLYACSGHNKAEANRINRIEQAVQEVCKDFDIQSCAYVIDCGDGRSRKKMDASLGAFPTGKDLLKGFVLPLYLRRVLQDDPKAEQGDSLDKTLSGDSLLQKYFSSISDKTLKVNDLIRIPAEQETIDPHASDSTSKWIQQLTFESKLSQHAFAVEELELESFKLKEGEDTSVSCKTLLHDLTQISRYFDRENLTGYRPIGKDIPDPYPTWYAHNLVGMAGWRILRFEKHVVLWHYIHSENCDVLMLKGIDRPFFVATAFPSGKISSPLMANQQDVLLSPFATAILKAVFHAEDAENEAIFASLQPDYAADLTLLSKQMEGLKQSSYNFLYYKELLSNALSLEKTDKTRSEALFQLYSKLVKTALPREAYQKPLLASFNYVPDNFRGNAVFTLDTTTRISIQAITQKQYGTDKGIQGGVDAVELHFGTKNLSGLMTHYYHTMFRNYNQIEGVFDQKYPARYVFKDLDDTSYVVAVSIPWENIGVDPSKVHVGMRMKFDAVLYDNDIVEYRKSVLSWSVLRNDNLQKPDSMGTLILSNKSGSVRNTNFYCPYLDLKGTESLEEVLSNKSVRQMKLCPIELPVAKGTWSNNDNSGGFKAFWNKKALYVVFEALDNIKNSPMYLYPDKAYLEKVNGGSIWKAMGTELLQTPVYLTRQTLTLPAGTYRVRYQSDRNHSFEHWLEPVSMLDNYGVWIWKQ